MRSVPPSQGVDQPLDREEAERIARRVHYADDAAVPAAVELLLVCANPDAPRSVRLWADRALDALDPWAEDRLPEPEAFRSLRWCFYAYDLEERKKALPFLLEHLSRWAA